MLRCHDGAIRFACGLGRQFDFPGPLLGVGSNTKSEQGKGGGYLDGQLAKEQDRINTTDAQRAAVAALGEGDGALCVKGEFKIGRKAALRV